MLIAHVHDHNVTQAFATLIQASVMHCVISSARNESFGLVLAPNAFALRYGRFHAVAAHLFESFPAMRHMFGAAKYLRLLLGK